MVLTVYCLRFEETNKKDIRKKFSPFILGKVLLQIQ